MFVKIFVYNSQDKILILQRGGVSNFQRGLWELPGGKVHTGESLISAVRRELWEETHLDIEVPEQEGSYDERIMVVNAEEDNGYSEQTARTWVAVTSTALEALPADVFASDQAEHSAYMWSTPEELRTLYSEGMLSSTSAQIIYTHLLK